MKELAVVTGATGIVGSQIVEMLLQKGYSVRILTRSTSFSDDRLQVICGDLQNTTVVSKLLEGAKLLFSIFLSWRLRAFVAKQVF